MLRKDDVPGVLSDVRVGADQRATRCPENQLFGRDEDLLQWPNEGCHYVLQELPCPEIRLTVALELEVRAHRSADPGENI